MIQLENFEPRACGKHARGHHGNPASALPFVATAFEVANAAGGSDNAGQEIEDILQERQSLVIRRIPWASVLKAPGIPTRKLLLPEL
jgi:hypothetical protein